MRAVEESSTLNVDARLSAVHFAECCRPPLNATGVVRRVFDKCLEGIFMAYYTRHTSSEPDIATRDISIARSSPEL